MARVTVMGLGRFGGGAGVVRWLLARGDDVIVTDLAPPEGFREPVAALEQEPSPRGRITWRLGAHEERDFRETDLVVVNPAVPRPWTNRFLDVARQAGVPLTTEMRLLWERIDPQRVIGVTGTSGKSTTTAMIHHVLRAGGARVHVGGNIGGSLLPELDAIGPADHVVLELSSAMLYWLGPESPGAPPFRAPAIGVCTNIVPNHLDWHGDEAHYRRAKAVLFHGEHPPRHAIRGDDLDVPDAIELSLPGAHNRRNAWTAAVAAGYALGCPPAALLPRLRDFRGLPHRLELVAQAGDQRFFNDSKATVPDAVRLAVAAFPEPKRVHLIAGGYDKGVDLAPIATLAAGIAGLYTIGTTGPGLAGAARTHGAHASSAETLAEAVERAMDAMGPEDVLLLSPGCASWDQFENYEARGDAFRAAVEARVKR